MVLVQKQYKAIRKRLDELGYHQPCSMESVILVDKLLNALSTAQDKIKVYEDLANNSSERCNKIENSMEKYKKENKRLLKENNQMHLDLIKCREETEKIIKEHKTRINDLENMYSDLEFNFMEQMANIATLRQELLEKTNALYEFGVCFEEDKLKRNRKEQPQFEDVSNNTCKKDELDNFKKKQRQLLDENELLENQVQLRDKEIMRLRNQLEEHNSYINNVNNQLRCSCHSLNSCHLPIQNLKSIDAMKDEIKEAQYKQHEAMERAISLAERNEKLEAELNRVKLKYEFDKDCLCGKNITLLQKQHSETLNKIKDMEIRITNLQTLINNTTKEKNEAKDRINELEIERNNLCDKLEQFKILEQNLMLQTEVLQQNNKKLENELANTIETMKTSIMNTETAKKSLTDTQDGKINSNLFEQIKAERDYYCNELHRLQEKIYSAEKIHDTRCNSRTENRYDIKLMKKIESDVRSSKEENIRLQNEIASLREQLAGCAKYKYDCNKLLEEHIKKLENDNSQLNSANINIKNKLHNAEQNLEQFHRKINTINEELENYKVKYNHLKKLNMHLEMSLKNSQASNKHTEGELMQSMSRLNDLENQLKYTREELSMIKREKHEAREHLHRLDNEKDELLLKIDEKTVIISKLDRELIGRNSQISQLEHQRCKLKTELQTLERMLQVGEEKSLNYERDLKQMDKEIHSLHAQKESLHLENQTLKRELQAVCQDNAITSQTMEKYKKESEDLKRQLQSYVDEVRRVENVLLEKERERDLLLQQFTAISAEASVLESNQQSLECEASLTRDSLRNTQDKLCTLQKDVNEKDSLVSNMQNQVGQLSNQVVQLQTKIAEMDDREHLLSTDLTSVRNLCSTLEDQKRHYNEQLSHISSQEKHLRNELERLECENQVLQSQLGYHEQSGRALENIIASSRHDVIEKTIYNDDLMKEMQAMKETVTALESKLNSVKLALSDCQSTCADYRSQNIELQRQITNEKFERAKEWDSNSTSL